MTSMGKIASQITSLTIVYSTVYSDADQRKYQSSASLNIVRGIHRRPMNSPHKWPVTRKMFPFDDVIMTFLPQIGSYFPFWSISSTNMWYLMKNNNPLTDKILQCGLTGRTALIAKILHSCYYIIHQVYFNSNITYPCTIIIEYGCDKRKIDNDIVR